MKRAKLFNLNIPITKCADKAVLFVVSPHILRLWIVTIPGTVRNVSFATEKLMSCGIPKHNSYSVKLHLYSIKKF